MIHVRNVDRTTIRPCIQSPNDISLPPLLFLLSFKNKSPAHPKPSQAKPSSPVPFEFQKNCSERKEMAGLISLRSTRVPFLTKPKPSPLHHGPNNLSMNPNPGAGNRFSVTSIKAQQVCLLCGLISFLNCYYYCY